MYTMYRYYRLFKNLSNGWLYFLVKLGLTANDSLVFKTRNHIEIEVPRRLMHEFKEIFMDECYLNGLQYPIPKAPIIIDVGANAGFFSLFAASRFPGCGKDTVRPKGNTFPPRACLQERRWRSGGTQACCLYTGDNPSGGHAPCRPLSPRNCRHTTHRRTGGNTEASGRHRRSSAG